MTTWRVAFLIGERGGVGWRAYAYRVGALTPEPTEADVLSGAFVSYILGQSDRSPHVLSALGYTQRLAIANLQRYLPQHPEATP